MRRFIVIAALLLSPAVAVAQSLTVRDVVELSKAGLGAEAILALIEVNRPVFSLDVDTLKGLKDAGVQPAVILAMIKSGRTAPPEPTLPLPQPLPSEVPAPPAPQVVVIDHHQDEPRVREIAVPVPVYVPVRARFRGDRDFDHRVPSHKPAEPVYWGWGGKLRPDAWKPTVADIQKDARVPKTPQNK